MGISVQVLDGERCGPRRPCSPRCSPRSRSRRPTLLSRLPTVPASGRAVFPLSRPSGHVATQFPQAMQVVSRSGLSMAGFITDLKPLFTKPRAEAWMTSEQVLMQRPQLMHLLGSRAMKGWALSILYCRTSPTNRAMLTPKSEAYFLRGAVEVLDAAALEAARGFEHHLLRREAELHFLEGFDPLLYAHLGHLLFRDLREVCKFAFRDLAVILFPADIAPWPRLPPNRT